ncbi:DUF6932 family protein [Pseudomonas fragi]|uniref:DUF6932 family protein n=1 Tax=Pseudomonas fragi TaxID=296 RepID=UPI0028EE1085|nr:hypothetical protein [Pseudomonas fragi]
MAKPDFPPLLPPGMHSLSLQQLHDLAVVPFEEDQKRAELFQKLQVWIEAIKASGIGGQLWLDGSFLTEKNEPSDIDCILWSPRWVGDGMDTPETRDRLARLFDHAHAESIYGLDFYLETPAPDQILHREAYWRGILGFCHDRVTAKGFAEITL